MADAFLPSLPPLAYVGPETFLPLASAIAAVLGAILFLWRWIITLPGRLFGRTAESRSAVEGSESPEAHEATGVAVGKPQLQEGAESD